MLNWIYILAQQRGDDDGWSRYIFGVLIVIFWLVSAGATWINKKQEEARRQRAREQLEMEQSGRSRPKPTPVVVPPHRAPTRRTAEKPQRPLRVPPVTRPQPQRQPQRQPVRPTAKPAAKQPQRQPRPARFAPPPVRPLPEDIQPLQTTRLPVSATELSGDTPPTVTPTSATAASVARWLNPATLRQQFILTEIIQPPVALRHPPE
jgi:hypothetical protein